MQIWDFGGEHQFKNLMPNYAIGAAGGIFMCDISRFSSLTNFNEWLKVLNQTPDRSDNPFPILLVAGKKDLELEGKRVIEKEFAFDYGKKHNVFDFIECSSKTGENIDKVFDIIARKMLALADLL